MTENSASNTTPPKRAAAIIVAAGRGERAGGGIPKQFRSLGGRPLFLHSVAAMQSHPAIGEVVLVVAEDQEVEAREFLEAHGCECALVPGGAERQHSVLAGLKFLAAHSGLDHVLIHDAARPGLSRDVIERLLEALEASPGAIPALPVADSLCRSDGSMRGEPVDRDNLYRVQTPQAFRFADILDAHRILSAESGFTDDASMLEAAGGDVALVKGDERLAKFTFEEDFATMNALFEAPKMRIGQGYDVHRLEAGADLWLCGIKIDHDRGLAGHSDADVGLHAIVDAVLGAIADGDIGTHFPPSDPKWKGARSRQFLEHAIMRAREHGYTIANIDLTLICEEPKIGPHRAAMVESVAQIAGLDPKQVSIKATTTERLGFTGRGEGIAAQAIVLLQSS